MFLSSLLTAGSHSFEVRKISQDCVSWRTWEPTHVSKQSLPRGYYVHYPEGKEPNDESQKENHIVEKRIREPHKTTATVILTISAGSIYVSPAARGLPAYHVLLRHIYLNKTARLLSDIWIRSFSYGRCQVRRLVFWTERPGISSLSLSTPVCENVTFIPPGPKESVK